MRGLYVFGEVFAMLHSLCIVHSENKSVDALASMESLLSLVSLVPVVSRRATTTTTLNNFKQLQTTLNHFKQPQTTSLNE